MIELFNEDCMDGMRRYPDNHFDLAIVDPPYGINITNNFIGKQLRKRDYKLGKWDESTPDKEYFEEIERISHKQIIWGGNYFIDKLKPFKNYIIWDKQNDCSNVGDCEQAYCSFNGVPRIFRFNRFKEWHYPDKIGGRIHPTQKPVKLYEWLLKNYAKPGDKILDTHGGSMSSAIACHNMGHDLVLFELDKDYFEAGRARLIEHQKQQSLFDDNF